jgi:hypothetical protein
MSLASCCADFKLAILAFGVDCCIRCFLVAWRNQMEGFNCYYSNSKEPEEDFMNEVLLPYLPHVHVGME